MRRRTRRGDSNCGIRIADCGLAEFAWTLDSVWSVTRAPACSSREGTYERGQVFEASFGSLDAVGVNPGQLGRAPILLRVIPCVDCLGGVDAERGERGGENARVRLVGADLAGDDDGLKIMADTEMLENRVEAAVEIRDNPEFAERMEGIQNGGDLGVKRPDAGLGKVGVELLEHRVKYGGREVVAAGCEDIQHQSAPPELVVVRPGYPGGNPGRGSLEGYREGRREPAFVQFHPMPGRDLPVMPAHAVREVDQRAGGIEEDGLDGHGRGEGMGSFIRGFGEIYTDYFGGIAPGLGLAAQIRALTACQA